MKTKIIYKTKLQMKEEISKQVKIEALSIADVMLSLRFINEKLKSKHRSSIYFLCGGKN